MNVSLSHLADQGISMRAINKHSTKPFSREDKRLAIELWRAKVPLSTIRKQLKMSERSLRRILSVVKSNPDAPVVRRKRDPRRLQEVIQRDGAATKY
jgi:isocitrate dehydrogenase